MVCHTSTWLCGRAPMTTRTTTSTTTSTRSSSFKLEPFFCKFKVSCCITFPDDSSSLLSFRGYNSVKKTPLDHSPEIFRSWIEADLPPFPSQDRFTVVSYNILADKNASEHKDLYSNISHSYIKWECRKRVICEEVIGWDPDIVCFQEVDKYFDLLRIMEKAGYIGSYKRRTGNSIDGCAMFWKPDKFRLLEGESIEFKEFGLRDNVAQLSVFEMCNAESRRLLIGNIHVLYYPGRGDVKLGQSRFLSSRAHILSKRWGNVPVMLAGDFNSTPQSAIYKFLSTSELDIMSYDRREMSGQKSCDPDQVFGVKRATGSPSSFMDRFSKNYCWTDDELKVATGSTECRVAVHPLKLNSSYAALKGSEPLATSYHSKFLGTVDYLWYSDGIIPTKILDTVPIDVLRSTGGLPCEKCCGDDLKVMSLVSYQAALPRAEEKNWELIDKQGLNAPLFHICTNKIAHLYRMNVGSDHLALVSEFAFTQGTEGGERAETIAPASPTLEEDKNQLN